MKLLTSLFIVFFTASALAENVYVAPVKGTDVSEKKLKGLRELIKVQVQQQGDHRLVNNLEKADSTIQTKLIKFNNYTMSMARWKGEDKVRTGQYRAKSLADLETSVSLAVKEMFQNAAVVAVKGKDTGDLNLGEQAERKQQRASFQRVKSGRQVMVGFGPTWFSKMNTSESALGFQAGYFWNIDDHFDLGLQSDFAISTEDSDAYSFVGKVVTNYFFMASDISPFLGAGFGYGFASVHDDGVIGISDDTASGFALSAQAGVKFFRTSDVNFTVSAEYTNILGKSSLGSPGIFMLKAGLFF